MTPPRPSLPGIVPEAPIGRDALRHPVLWFRAHPMAWDAVLATAIAAIPFVVWLVGPTDDGIAWRDPDAGLVLAIALASVPLVWRRTHPLVVMAVTLAGTFLHTAAGYSSDYGPLGELVALYTVAAHCPKRTSRRTLMVVAAVLVPLLFWPFGPDGSGSTLGEVAAGFLLYGVAWLVGENLQTRRANVVALHERAEKAEQAREVEAQRAVEAERTRIAREMHDVVAHSMSVMVVQASGARRVLDKQPAQAEQALALIEQTGREALTEMRRLLGVLRDGDDVSPNRGPQPSLDALDDLVAECAASGLPVEVVRVGDGDPLPPGVDLAAYRIVQEALTNVLRHAGRATATVTVTYSTDAVGLEVSDDGRGLSASRPADGTGHGLVGMRERAALYGGTLAAGPGAGGGFTVKAALPRSTS